MTISYAEEFSSLMLRWRGSLWKAVLKDLIAYYIAYYVVLAFQWYLLDEKQKEYFTGWINWCEIGAQYIPLSFLLGFFVSVIVARWWEQFNAAIAWSGISVRTLKRFPTERHLVEAKLMTEEEYDLYMSLDAPHGKWFMPTIWIVNLIKKQYHEKKIDSIQLELLLKQEITILFPIFTTFQMLFYLGWLKVGQFLMNPFGEDDDDFELNYILDRNNCIAYQMATEMADQLPNIHGVRMLKFIPHTRASFKIQDVIPKSHLASFRLPENEMKLIKPEDLEKYEHQMEETRKSQRRRQGTSDQTV
ncbi:hypothetical protein WR25_12486 isoform B [Diploscapter pachys]|uniref:Bestrophin homolog n=1 Tax=Diploscapter pachys TaxID=2018661 RepID=A0A2A2KDC6_9BILA|nr:hypothetical protein WR25_12486 isoform B [Diploscapter pachys]